MVDFVQISPDQCELVVDISIFNEQVVSKMTYWLSENYCIYWKKKTKNEQTIIFENKQGVFSEQGAKFLKEKINQLLIDFKNRDIIRKETGNVRDILYIKAFANNDDYEDFSLKAE